MADVPPGLTTSDSQLQSLVDKGLVLNNSGTCPLQVTNITSSSPEFEVPGVQFYPLLLASGSAIEVPVCSKNAQNSAWNGISNRIAKTRLRATGSSFSEA